MEELWKIGLKVIMTYFTLLAQYYMQNQGGKSPNKIYPIGLGLSILFCDCHIYLKMRHKTYLIKFNDV